ncbi:MAG: Lrp/AsnC family transcriptional regulator [Candidatus Bathyarchaeota archaeon]|nr:Lrp/AsnC family transcriptional regulator [Candidatus Bathyarchaeota archaeon]
MSLSERDIEVLAFLSEEEFTFFTFEGLKRRLSLHPETLSRIINRLEAEGVIKKSDEGYIVAKEIAQKLKQYSNMNNTPVRVILLQTYLPSDIPTQELVSNLRGKWFGLLRWLGLAKNNEETTLKWVTENGEIQLDAKITKNTLTIEAKFLDGCNQNLALKASYQLMTHISKICQNQRPSQMPSAQKVSYFGN